jgi:formate hydrogenlyase subunit 6/NADH:ubiquinone oxidoreductase subunit I
MTGDIVVQIAVAVGVLLSLLGGVGVILYWTGRPLRAWPYPVPELRVDERDIVFSRKTLRPGTAAYEEYYRRRPEYEAKDREIREAPGARTPGTAFYNPLMTAADVAGFQTLFQVQRLAEGAVAPERVEGTAEEYTRFVKAFGRYLGAHSVGIARLEDRHLYSHVGYSFVDGQPKDWGKPIVRRHAFAIVLTVEMDEEMTATAPGSSAGVEAVREYLRGAVAAVYLAQTLRNLGYEARAHLSGQNEIQWTTLAKDAGLGEIGRMGLLMTPDLGPRVRLTAVTTDLPLLPDAPTHDEALLDFCTRCNKCAVSCPAKAIPLDEARQHPGEKVLRWRLDAEACFLYWHKAGTYCGRCLAVCPLSHPGHPFTWKLPQHIRRNAWFQRFALWQDDWRFGKKPAPRPVPEWIDWMSEKRRRTRAGGGKTRSE